NRVPDKLTVGPCPGNPGRTCHTTTHYLVGSFGYFSVQKGGRGVRFSGPGVKARIDHKNDVFTNYVVRFAPIRQGQSRTFRATYHLPAAGPRSSNNTRITDAYAHFCWHGQPTDRGSVTAFLPKSFVPETQHAQVTQKRSKKGVILRSRRKTDLGRFYACTDSFKPEKLVRTETVSPGGQIVTVEGWPEDPKWTEEITKGVERTLPELEEIAGTPIPGDEIVVRQVAAQALGGYAGDFSGKSEQIRVGETYDDSMLVAHELAHAWFNRKTVKDTWIMEGHAEWMAAQANHLACPLPGDYPGKGKPKLSEWQYLGVNPSQREQDVVDYQYTAACAIVQRIELLAGLDRMPEISRALLERSPKYGGSARKKMPKPDWREWLDAVDELGVVPGGRGDWRTVENTLVEYGVVKSRQLKGRAAAREEYHEALDGPLAEVMPVAVRDLMDDWQFDKAMRALDVSERIVSAAVAAEEAGTGGVVAWVGPVLRDARSIDDLRAIRKRLHADPTSFEPAPSS
ncbi:MAG: hypothetical protein U9O18_07330, partial [Chloroflexota bacterium]|nr:hypothetical protein [Chloroflexota bacterium]